uniref:Gamma-glutamylcyclotransferase family protein n=1 Tax=Magallana gigas TaxID=29159 RepID=A0A8W8M8I2_MAGGI
MKRIFVYGTLKNGQPNHFRLMDPGTGTTLFVGVGQTVEKYPLVIERSWNMPCLLQRQELDGYIRADILISTCLNVGQGHLTPVSVSPGGELLEVTDVSWYELAPQLKVRNLGL